MRFIEIVTCELEYESKDSYDRITKIGKPRIINVDAIQQIMLNNEQPKNESVSIVYLASGSFLCLGTPSQVAAMILKKSEQSS